MRAVKCDTAADGKAVPAGSVRRLQNLFELTTTLDGDGRTFMEIAAERDTPSKEAAA